MIKDLNFFNLILTKDMFDGNTLEAMCLGMMPNNRKAYMEMEDSGQFIVSILENASNAQKKALKLVTLSSSNEEKLLSELTSRISEVAAACSNTEKSIDDDDFISSDSYNNLMKKQIQLSIKALKELINSSKGNKKMDRMDLIREEETELITVLSFLYFENHPKEFKMAENKRDKHLKNSLILRYKWLLYHQQQAKKLFENQNKLWMAKTEKEIANKNKVIEDKKTELSKAYKALEEKKNQLKTIEKKKEQIALNHHKKDLLEAQQKANSLEKQLGILKAETVPREIHDKVASDLADFKKTAKELALENNRLKNQKSDISHLTLEKQLEDYLKINGLTEPLLQIFYPYYKEYMDGKKPTLGSSQKTADYYLGVCKVREEGHFFIDADGNERRIFNIPDDQYLGQNQFIGIDGDGNFSWAYNFQHTLAEQEGVCHYGLIELDAENTYVVLQNDEKILAKNPNDYNLKQGKIVGLNDSFEIIFVYKNIRFNADLFLDSAIYRKQKVYHLHQEIEKGWVARDIKTDCIQFVQLEISTEKKLEEHAVIFVKNAKVIKTMPDGLFYTASNLYKRYEEGEVCEKNGNILFEKSNGEKRLLRNLPETISIQTGDQIRVDEFFHLIRKNEYSRKPFLKCSPYKFKKRLKRIKGIGDVRISRDTKTLSIPHKKEHIVIIGDKKLKQAYMLTLLRHGYQSEVVDGCGHWQKLAKAVRAADLVVFVTEHATHAHYNKFKTEFVDKKIIYSKEEGPHRILEQVKSVLEPSFC